MHCCRKFFFFFWFVSSSVLASFVTARRLNQSICPLITSMRQCGIVGDRSDPRCRKCILFVFNWISKCSLKLRMSFSVARYEIGLYILRTVEHSDIQNPDFIARLSAKCSISWTAVLQICFFFLCCSENSTIFLMQMWFMCFRVYYADSGIWIWTEWKMLLMFCTCERKP